MDILADVLDRVRLSGTLLFHYELGRPWSVALPRFPDAVFHYLSRGSAIVAHAMARIATHVGYETTTAFSKVFKQHYGFSPARYRARNGASGTS